MAAAGFGEGLEVEGSDMNYNFPTIDKVIKATHQIGAYWYDVDGNNYIDCFTDVGASPISSAKLNTWIQDGIAQGVDIRKPHAYHDLLRDKIYPMALGIELGMYSKVRVFYSSSGTESVETAIKLARRATDRSTVIGIHGDFHGRTYGALSLGRLPELDDRDQTPSYHFDGFGPFVNGIHAVTEETSREVPLRDVAAFVISPINGNNTLREWPSWVWRLATAIQDTGGLIVFDEIQTGFGRGGGAVSITQRQDFPVDPDIYCFGKAAGAGWPLSLTVAHSEIVDEVMTPGTHFNTMSGSPMGCYLSRRLITALNEGLLDEMLQCADRIELTFPNRIVRCGYMMAIKTDDPYGLVQRARENGVLLMTARPDQPVRLSPPFTMLGREEDELIKRLESILDGD